MGGGGGWGSCSWDMDCDKIKMLDWKDRRGDVRTVAAGAGHGEVVGVCELQPAGVAPVVSPGVVALAVRLRGQRVGFGRRVLGGAEDRDGDWSEGFDTDWEERAWKT